MDLAALLDRTLQPALGCTEPAAIALSAAAATQAALRAWRPHQKGAFSAIRPDQVFRVNLRASPGILKNAHSIEIPRSEGERGVEMAAALGVFCNPERQLEVFSDLCSPTVREARKLCRQGKIERAVEKSPCEVSILATVRLSRSGKQVEGQCRIEGEHSGIVSLQRDGQQYYGHRDPDLREVSAHLEELKRMTLAGLLKASADLAQQSRHSILKAIRMNQQVCQAGRLRPFGVGAGYVVEANCNGRVSAAVAGSDARMSGYPAPVMSLAGSGNQGITAIVPVAEYAQLACSPRSELVQAVALSCLMTLYASAHLGFLSPLCGVALKAGIGAACGIVFLKGGGQEEISQAVRLMVATHAGMICDGAKSGCALKVSAASEMALRVADLVMRGIPVQHPEGIVAPTAEETIRNLAKLQDSMGAADQQILKIIQGSAGDGEAHERDTKTCAKFR